MYSAACSGVSDVNSSYTLGGSVDLTDPVILLIPHPLPFAPFTQLRGQVVVLPTRAEDFGDPHPIEVLPDPVPHLPVLSVCIFRVEQAHLGEHVAVDHHGRPVDGAALAEDRSL